MTARTLLATAAALAILTAPAAAGSSEKRSTLSCANAGTVDISMSARNTVRTKKGDRRLQFKVEFEAAPGLPGFAAGTVLRFAVDGQAIGSRPLRVVPNGDLEAELELDSKKRGAKAVPAGFSPKKGSLVEVLSGSTVVLSCALK